ncbi:MAG: hypothetical protein NVS3B17_19740 [Vulcanimicrobiaceae bacterium]
MIDACMRALHRSGWIDSRMRAMLMSFASYHLWLHWRPTAVYLGSQFLDFEAGTHYPQSQMQSGTTGINTLRIYSPTKQARDWDPDGAFIRRYVPELTRVPAPYIAERMRCRRYLRRRSTSCPGATIRCRSSTTQRQSRRRKNACMPSGAATPREPKRARS